jgi:hypothetical protein
MARSGMSDLIQQIRVMCNVERTTVTVNGNEYWSDDHLQQILDRHRMRLDYMPIVAAPQVGTGGTSLYYEYRAGMGNLESGTAVFWLQDGSGAKVGTANYTMDYNIGLATFTIPTGGSAFYITGRSYDLNAAAADVWTMKAGQVASGAFSWSSDNMSVNKTGLIAAFTQTAQMYRNLARVSSVDMLRGDEVACGDSD